MPCCGIWEKFGGEKNLIKEYKYWKLLVGYKNKGLGYCVVITKEHHESLADLSDEEMVEYRLVVKELEGALKKLFNYDRIHHLLLMFYDNHTHFHIFPRYKELRNFAGMEWIDDFAPNPLGKNLPKISQDVINQIKEAIKENL